MDLRRSSELAQQALALDDSNGSALVLASRLDYLQKRFEDAVAEARRATGIDPNYVGGYAALAEALNVAGYPDDAIRAAEKAMRLDPSGQEAYSYEVGLAYVLLERYQAAITVFKRHLAAYPNSLYAHLDLVIAYTELGRDQEARAEAAEVMRISPQYVVPTPESGLLKDVALNKRYESDQHKAGLK